MMRGLVLGILLSTILAGCGPPAEEPLIGAFFQASRLRDRTALQKLATTSFDPAAQGMIISFDITGVSVKEHGALTTKDVAISAPVRMMSGHVVQKRLVVTIEQRERGGWMVTAVTEVPASAPSTPPS